MTGTVAAINTALNGLTYRGTPNYNATRGAETLTVVTNDQGNAGAGGPLGDTDVVAITVSAVNDAPTAQAKGFTVQANMQVVGVGDLLTGATDPDSGDGGYTASFSVNDVLLDNCPNGTISNVNAAAGTFDFDPPPGVTSPTTCTLRFRLADSGNPGPAATSAYAQITVTINGPVIWFVDPSVAGPGSGTLLDPFKFLSGNAGAANDADDVDAANQRIFLYAGTHTTGIALNTGERLIGQGVTGSSFDSVFGITAPAGTIRRPDINTGTATVQGTVTLNTDAVVSGLSLSTDTATGLSDPGGAITGVTVDQVSVTSTTGTAVLLSDTAGSLTLTSVSANGAANGISLTNVGASLTASGGTIQNTTTAAVLVDGGAGSVTYGGSLSTGTGRPVQVQNRTGGTVTFSGPITATGQGILVQNNNTGTNTVVFSGSQQQISTATGTGVSLASNTGATISFTGGNLDVTTTTGTGFSATGGGTVTVQGSGNTISTNGGQAAVLNGVSLGSGGVTFASVAVGGSPAADALAFTTVGGPGGFTSGTTSVAGTTGATADGIDITTSSAAFTFGSVTIDSTGGDGVHLANNTGAVAVNGGTIGATNDPAGNVVDVDQSSAGVTVAASLTKSTAGRIVEVTGRTGGTATISGTLSCTGACTGINVASNTGGTVAFTANGSVLNTGANTAITLGSNSGATINFSGSGLNVDTTGGRGVNMTGAGTANFTGGAMTIDTTTGNGFDASGGGTVNVTGSNNTITSTGATALNVANTTIGSSGMTFRSISAGNNTAAADPTNGIVLNNTGSTAGLTVTGNGTSSQGGDNSGGEIQNTSGDGVSLTNTKNVSLTNMNIHHTVGDGVGGTLVNGFTFANGKIDRSGLNAGLGVVGATGTSNIGFHDIGSGVKNLEGAVSVTASNLTNAFYHGFDSYNESGTITNLTLTNNVLTGTGSDTTSKGSGIHVDVNGSASTAAAVTRATVSSNTIDNFSSGAGIQVQGGNAAFGPAVTLGTPSSGTNVITIATNVIGSASITGGIGTNGILAGVTGTGQGKFSITNNGTPTVPIRHFEGIGIAAFGGDEADVVHIVQNNVIDASDNIANSSGMSVGSQLSPGRTGSIMASIMGNTINGMEGNGILAGVTNSNNTGSFVIQNNTVGAPQAGARPGIRVESGSTNGNTSLCLDMSGNTTAGSALSPSGIGLRKQGTDPAVNAFRIVGMAATSTPGVEQYVGNGAGGKNPGTTSGAGGDGSVNGVLLISAASGFGSCSAFVVN